MPGKSNKFQTMVNVNVYITTHIIQKIARGVFSRDCLTNRCAGIGFRAICEELW